MIFDIPGYEGLYGVNIIGEVCSWETSEKKGRWLKPGIKDNGYEVVVLVKKGEKRTHHVHSLVMLAFKGIKGTRKRCINHKGGVKTDNRLSNLEIISKSEDLKHAYRTGLRG